MSFLSFSFLFSCRSNSIKVHEFSIVFFRSHVDRILSGSLFCSCSIELIHICVFKDIVQDATEWKIKGNQELSHMVRKSSGTSHGKGFYQYLYWPEQRTFVLSQGVDYNTVKWNKKYPRYGISEWKVAYQGTNCVWNHSNEH